MAQDKKIETKQKKQPFEKVEYSEIEIKRILVVTDKEEKFVTQIRFTDSNDEDFTYKPKKRIEEVSKYRGLELIKRSSESITMDELPEIIYKMNDLLNENGSVKITTDYTIMNTEDKDGNEVSYKFFSEKDFSNIIVEGLEDKETE